MEASNREWQADELERRAELRAMSAERLARALVADVAESLRSIMEHGNTDLALVATDCATTGNKGFGIVVETPRGRVVLKLTARASAWATETDPESAWEAKLATMQAREAADARSGEGEA
jgi:hypothetical protein